MKTWAKQLEEALPHSCLEVRERIMDEYCPYHVFGEESAPEYRLNEPHRDGNLCEGCWDSCESKCAYSNGTEPKPF